MYKGTKWGASRKCYTQESSSGPLPIFLFSRTSHTPPLAAGRNQYHLLANDSPVFLSTLGVIDLCRGCRFVCLRIDRWIVSDFSFPSPPNACPVNSKEFFLRSQSCRWLSHPIIVFREWENLSRI